MALPLLADVTDLATLLNQTIAGADAARAASLLVSASSLVRAESGSPWVNSEGDLLWAGSTDPNMLLVQETLVSVTLAAAGRAYNNPDGLIAETLGPYSARWAEDGSGVFLTEDEQRAIARAVALLRGDTSPGLWTLGTTRGDGDTRNVTDTVFVGTEYSAHPELDGEPLPYRAIGDPS